MDQLTKTSLLINPFKFKRSCPVTIFHHSIVSANNACKKAEANDALAILMFQAFIIDKRNLVGQHSLQQLLISRLLLFGMRKKQVGLFWNQLFDGNFLDTE